MVDKKYLLMSLEDESAKDLAGVLSSKVCKKIIDVLAEEELSEQDLAEKLNLPLNTLEYNLNKLLKSHLVEKTKNFFWSKKGKKINLYKLSNKSIIISPSSKRISSKLKSILPATIISLAGAFLIKVFSSKPSSVIEDQQVFAKASMESASVLAKAPSQLITNSNLWIWFLVGSLFAILTISILNWRKL